MRPSRRRCRLRLRRAQVKDLVIQSDHFPRPPGHAQAPITLYSPRLLVDG
jgi:hypothetical protein